MTVVSARLPAGAEIHSTDLVGAGDIPKNLGVPEEILTWGATYGHAYDVGYKEQVIPAGAPGSVDVDLLVGTGVDGGNLGGLAGKCVYLEIRVISGTDCQVKRSAANGVLLFSGNTDTMSIYGSATLIRHLENPGYTTFTPPLFDATHKLLTVQSTGGCTVRILLVVI